MSALAAPKPMDEDGARRITEEIRSLVVQTRGAIEQVQRLLTEAREGQAHVALGYAENEWTRYMKDLFANEPLRLPRDQRQELVGLLTGEGMSTRAIAGVTGTSHETARKDQVAGVKELTPEPSTLTDEPGRVMKLTGEGSATDYRVDLETSRVSDDYLPDDAPGEEVTTSTEAIAVADDAEEAPGGEVEPSLSPAPSRPEMVTSLNGVQQPRHKAEPKAPRRKALTDSFWKAAYDLGKRVESVHRLTEDDRFPQNAEKVAAAHRNDLLRYRDLLEQVISQLPEA